MSEQATPRPWTHSADEGVYDTISGGMGVIADGVMRADASLIVRAVNAHDDLVAALRALVEASHRMQPDPLVAGVNASVPRPRLFALWDAEHTARALIESLSPKEEGQ